VKKLTDYIAPGNDERVYQYTDVKGRHCRYELTDTELAFIAYKDGLPVQKEHYLLEDIGRVNLKQRVVNYYVISITFHRGTTLRITSEDFSFNVGNQRAHHVAQRLQLRQWIDYLHERLCERELATNIKFTSGSSVAYQISRVGRAAFNLLMAGIAVLLIAYGDTSFNLLSEIIAIGLAVFAVNYSFVVLDTKEPTQPYSPKSLPWKHIPAEGASFIENVPGAFKIEPRQVGKGKVVAHSPGNGKFEGMLGGLIVQIDDGREFKLGTGFSNDTRASPPTVGSIVHFKYHGLTTKGLPRYASFLSTGATMFSQSDGNSPKI
jgi:hypothetical protein